MSLIHSTADRERGFTLIELCVVIVILAILMATGVAALLRARTASNETSAIGSLRSINSGQASYSAVCGGGNYATSLAILGLVPPGGKEGYISPELGISAAPQLNGYTFNIRPGAGSLIGLDDCFGNPTQTRWYALAVPVALGQTGSRSFAINQQGAVWQEDGGVPPPEPFGPPSLLVQ